MKKLLTTINICIFLLSNALIAQNGFSPDSLNIESGQNIIHSESEFDPDFFIDGTKSLSLNTDLRSGFWNSDDGGSTIYFNQGEVGIGYTRPNSKLHINANSAQVGLRVQINGSSKFTVASNGGVSIGAFENNPPSSGLFISGNTGIGTSTPTEKLHVVGNALVTGSLQSKNFSTPGNSIEIGESASAGTNDVVIGRAAGFPSTSNSVVIGYQAGQDATGSNHVFIGRGAGIFNNGQGNIGIGMGAASYNNNVNNVVAIGYEAGKSNTLHSQFIVHQNNVNTTPLIQGDFASGNVGIGTTNPTEKLTVNGKILATEVEVVSQIQSDFVFEPDYVLMNLEDVEKFVKENKHLPEIPSMHEFAENGQNIAEVQDLLLRKIEELTLYVISQQKEIEELKQSLTEIEE